MEMEEQWRVPLLGADKGGSSSSEDIGGGLGGRRRKSAKDATFRAREGNGEKRDDEEHWRSVYFDQADGTIPPSEFIVGKNHTDDAYEKDHNEMSSGGTPQSEIEVLTSIVSKSEVIPSSETVVHKYGVEGQHKDGTQDIDKWNDVDLEKVLEEQDTHDLYCPNCNSCITKRVILRKRKRKAREVHYLKREKIEPVRTNIITPDEDDDLDERPEQQTYIFKCLSCFSCFIVLAEGGIKLLKGIWRRGSVDGSLPASPPISPESSREPSSLSRQKITEQDAQAAIRKLGLNEQTINNGQPLDSGIYGLQTDSNRGQGSTMIETLQVQNFQPATLEIKDSQKFVKKPGLNEQTIDKGQSLDDLKYGLQTDSNRGQGSTMYETLQVQNFQPATLEIKDIAGEDLKSPFPYVPPMKGTDEAVKPLLENIAQSVPQPALLTRPRHDQEVSISVPPSSTYDVDILDASNQVGSTRDWDVLKAIVYGGLAEAIMSLGVISSAAGAQASTLNIIALGLANLIGGLILIFHDLLELRNEEYGLTDPENEENTNYGRSLGKRGHFKLHATVALLSYIIFGILPPIVYGFSFRNSGNKEYKLISVAATSLPCIALLALAKAHVKRPPKPYIKSLITYIILGVSASGLAYVAGIFIEKFLENVHALDPDSLVSPPLPLEFLNSVWAG